VQGVGFRYAMICRSASRLGLTGWVRNRRDGSVEAFACGVPAALDALVSNGPNAVHGRCAHRRMSDRPDQRPTPHCTTSPSGATV
jgi:acylphosphatase